MTFKLFLSRFIILLTNLNIYAQQIVDLLVMSMKNYFIYIFFFCLILNSIHIKQKLTRLYTEVLIELEL